MHITPRSCVHGRGVFSWGRPDSSLSALGGKAGMMQISPKCLFMTKATSTAKQWLFVDDLAVSVSHDKTLIGCRSFVP